MLVSTFHGHENVVPLKTAPGTQSRNRTNHKKLIPVFPAFLSGNADKSDPLVKAKNEPFSSKMFSITFSYLQTPVHMKVLKVWYSGDQSIYKIVLTSALSKGTGMCWLQYRVPNWVLLLGQELNEKLQRAITSAIECQEF